MQILFLSRWFPFPPDNGSKIRVFHLLKALSARHEVTLLSFASEPVSAQQLEAARTYCQEVRVIPYRPFRPGGWRASMGYISSRPRSAVDTDSSVMRAQTARAVQERAFDVLLASQLDMAPYALDVDVPVRILEELELATLSDQYTQARAWRPRMRHGLTWWKQSRYVAHVLCRFTSCTVVSEAERNLAYRVARKCPWVKVVPNGVDIAACSGDFGEAQPETLVYSGALTYQANFDAVAFFVGEVLPLIQAQRPGVKLYVTGPLDGVRLDRLPYNPAVVFTGYLDDVRPRIAQSWVSVVPLRMGGGTRLKILEALALGTPVVSTRKGAEGLDLIPGRDLLVADKAQDLAQAVLYILRSREMRASLGLSGRQAVGARYDWARIGQQFVDFIESCVSTPMLAREDG